MSIEITVRGHSSTFRSPQRVTVVTTIGYEGPSMEPVYQQVARDLEILGATIAPLKLPLVVPSPPGRPIS